MDFDLAHFKSRVEIAVRQIIPADSADIHGFSLFSDSDGRSISAAVNSRAHLERRMQAEPDEDLLYLKWYPAEWEREGVESAILDELSAELFALELSGEAFEEHKRRLFDVIVSVLREAREDGLFKAFGDDFVLVFYITDDSEPERDAAWLEALNSPALFREYRNWMASFAGDHEGA